MSDGDVALVAKTVDNAINSGGNAKFQCINYTS